MDPLFEEGLLAYAKTAPEGVVEVYDRYADRLFGYFLKRSTHRETAEDLVSKVFVQFLKALPTLEWRGLPLEAWLFRAASNLLIDHWRSAGVRLEEELPQNEAWDPPSLEALPDQQADRRLGEERMLDVLKTLSPRDQQILDLRFFAQLEPVEIAKLLKISPNHASVRVYRALANLRFAYHEQYGE